jgi:hypothetical protein
MSRLLIGMVKVLRCVRHFDWLCQKSNERMCERMSEKPQISDVLSDGLS